MLFLPLVYVYLGVTLAVYILALFAVKYGGDEVGNIKKSKNSVAVLMLIIIIFILFFISGFRHITSSANDEYAYRNRAITFISSGFGKVFSQSTEYLFNTIVWIAAKLWNDSQSIFVVVSAITVTCFILAIRNYSDSFSFSVLMFMLIVYNGTFNGITQYMASAVLMLGSKYIYEHNFKKYLAVVILCTFIHAFSIVMLLVYFIAVAKPWSKRIVLSMVVAVICMLLFSNVIAPLLAKSSLFEDYESALTTGHHGVKLITVGFHAIPLVIAFLLRGKIDKDDKITNACVNIVLVNFLINLIATQEVYVARLALFTVPYEVILMSKLMTYIKKEGYYAVAYYFITIAYTASIIYFTRNSTYTLVLSAGHSNLLVG